MSHRDAFNMENYWNRKFTWFDAPDTTGTAPLASRKDHEVAETVPTEDTSKSLVNKRLDTLTAELDNHRLRLDGLEMDSRSSRQDSFTMPPKVSKRADHAGLLTQARSQMTPGANILADLKVITENFEDPKKTRRWTGMFKDHYSVSWKECQVLDGLARVETRMIDILNIRANVHALPKWQRPKNRPQRRQIQRICDYWIGLWHHDPYISVPSEASRQLWALYHS
ncbi:hypothetical protein PENSOL_c033G08765 [Penicillium solitum]|uniref:Uncharacterized protein n=1 Tax=Penicillium solitum TaxID=60172 RepID=A0A1V6QVW6_9EURO|nr:uncharacterized protein PENSOL_c033G08765 [Penicillium solitum]OQD93321.1 hypothetical protein PENSOL_c033G08765 [Penicillium solitum]